MLLEPDILLMDEPTKGLDAEFKQSFAAMVRSLLSGGVTVLMVSHDVEFCARYAHRCALFFDGSISAEGTPRTFFGGNSFYTTADRMARGLLLHAVTAEDVMAGIGGTVPPEPEVQHTEPRRCRRQRRDSPTGSPRGFRGGAGRWPLYPAPWRW